MRTEIKDSRVPFICCESVVLVVPWNSHPVLGTVFAGYLEKRRGIVVPKLLASWRSWKKFDGESLLVAGFMWWAGHSLKAGTKWLRLRKPNLPLIKLIQYNLSMDERSLCSCRQFAAGRWILDVTIQHDTWTRNLGDTAQLGFELQAE